jgi:hypothetical protein
MPIYRLDTSSAVTLNGSGNGSVTLQNGKPFQTLKVKKVSVSVTTDVLQPVAKVYLGSVSPGNLLDGTETGANDSSDIDATLMPGEYLTVEWTGGDSGAIATASFYGDVEDPR